MNTKIFTLSVEIEERNQMNISKIVTFNDLLLFFSFNTYSLNNI